MIPKNLFEWNLDIITSLVQQGVYETDAFDIKESLPHKNDEKGKNRLKRACCAFANSNGGFLVFGVKDDKSLTASDRIVGLEATLDFPEHFGNFPTKGNPAVQWEFRNPPIGLPDGRVLHVVWIPKSSLAPHGTPTTEMAWEFYKRTNKGNEQMSMEEIRAGFLNYYEKRIKLNLLKSELEQIRGNASAIANADPAGTGSHYSVVTFNLEVVNLVLADTYSLLAQMPELVRCLSEIRMSARIVNTKAELLFRQVSLPMSNREDIIKAHNANVIPNCSDVIEKCNFALQALDTFLATK